MENSERLHQLNRYEIYLYECERSENTVQKYLRDIRKFLDFLGNQPLDKSVVLAYKASLISDYAPASVNSMLAAVNGFLEWLGVPNFKVKPLKIQRDIFASPEKELTQREYERLVRTAEHRGNITLSNLIQTICATGIRVSELPYITVNALHTGRAVVTCKGKTRVVFLPKMLCVLLKKYCKHKQISQGAVFVSRSGSPLDRSNIWRMMKSLCREAGVAESKVFPHNLRHLFARTYYKIEKDISRLADILGHSSINTTRVYTIESGETHASQLNRMNLVAPT